MKKILFILLLLFAITLTGCIPMYYVEDDQYRMLQNTSKELDIFYNDYSYCCETTITNEPTNGTLTIEDGVYTYTPNQDFVGVDTFTYATNYQNQDDINEDYYATVTITVKESNSIPYLTPNTLYDTQKPYIETTLDFGDDDIEDIDILYIYVSKQGEKGFGRVEDNILTYYTNQYEVAEGEDSIEVTITDGIDSFTTTFTYHLIEKPYVGEYVLRESINEEVTVNLRTFIDNVLSEEDSIYMVTGDEDVYGNKTLEVNVNLYTDCPGESLIDTWKKLTGTMDQCFDGTEEKPEAFEYSLDGDILTFTIKEEATIIFYFYAIDTDGNYSRYPGKLIIYGT